MAVNKARILITDDEKSIRNTLRDILEYENYFILEAENGQTALEILSSNEIDLVLLDIKMKGMDGIEVLEKIRESGSEVPVILVSGHGTIEIAVEATKKGAFDFLEKPPDLNRLLVSIRNALENNKLLNENRQMRSKLHGVQEIIGHSPQVIEIKKTIDKVAPSQSRVLITGENGTGKELVALWIHEKSQRRSGPFIDVNCAAIPSELLESELFGHEKGAFTGADQQRIGKFEQADGGTIFLDEIGDMSLEAQAKVLRVLQEKKVTRVGGSDDIHVDVRVLAATNKDLNKEIDENRFREDLYHRINVIPIQVPPLRERKEDIPLLVDAYLQQLGREDISFSGSSFDRDAMEELKQMKWTGNVRELQNVVERLVLLAPDKCITKKDVQKYVTRKREDEEALDELIMKNRSFQDFKEEAERLFLIRKLEENDWNISQTAESIDIQRSHIYNKMRKYDIEK
jgi:two-component system, NtrC family, nitrogen regulation response regulator NtrX